MWKCFFLMWGSCCFYLAWLSWNTNLKHRLSEHKYTLVWALSKVNRVCWAWILYLQYYCREMTGGWYCLYICIQWEQTIYTILEYYIYLLTVYYVYPRFFFAVISNLQELHYNFAFVVFSSEYCEELEFFSTVLNLDKLYPDKSFKCSRPISWKVFSPKKITILNVNTLTNCIS